MGFFHELYFLICICQQPEKNCTIWFSKSCIYTGWRNIFILDRFLLNMKWSGENSFIRPLGFSCVKIPNDPNENWNVCKLRHLGLGPLFLLINLSVSITFIIKTCNLRSRRTDWNKAKSNLENCYLRFLSQEYDDSPGVEKFNVFTNIVSEALTNKTPRRRIVSDQIHRNPVPWSVEYRVSRKEHVV